MVVLAVVVVFTLPDMFILWFTNYLQKHINVFRCLQLKDIVRSGQDDFEFKLNDWSNNVEEFVDSSPRNLRQNLKNVLFVLMIMNIIFDNIYVITTMM